MILGRKQCQPPEKYATLIEIAHELIDMIRKNSSVDWDSKESVRTAKRLLRKYKYPAKKADGAVNIMIRQAELMSAGI